ncbi:MAG: hypothetical protein KGO49_12995 [Gammaproteobacteria bacterium]|nr:hypothetical protein [Gammaproteobacteria bacterium]
MTIDGNITYQHLNNIINILEGSVNHLCDYLIKSINYQPFKVSVELGEYGWMLKQESFATEQDVRSGEAEYFNEMIASSELKIYFCPFCGTKLD